MSADPTETFEANRRSWRADETLELAKARLRGIRIDAGTVEREFSEAQAELHRTKAQLTAFVGSAYMDIIDEGIEPSDIAHRALISIDELWLLLSGAYELTDVRWIRRVAAGFMATGPEGNIGRLGGFLAELESAATRFENVSRRRDVLHQQISDAEDNLRRLTADLAAFAVEGERRRVISTHSDGGGLATTVPDVQGYEHKPNPLLARSENEFLELLRRYRKWAGNPSYRDMAKRVSGGPSHATLANVLRYQEMPKKLRTLEAFVRGVGGGDDDVRGWVTAWRKLTSPNG